MARNSGDRLGASAVAAAGAPISEAPPNPMLAFATPTTFVTLPSRGSLYPENHPLHGREELEIRFMTAKEEDILTSQSLLKKGIAIDRMLQSIILDPKVKVEEIAVGDKNALIVAARISGYGKDYEVGVTCPSCNSQTEFSFDLEKHSINYGEDLEEFDVVKTTQGTFMIKTPTLGVEVELRPMYGSDERYLSQLTASKRRKNLPETVLTDQLKRLVLSVNGDNSSQVREAFIQNAPALDTRYIRQAYRQVMPNIDLTQEFVCSSCGVETEMAVPLTAKFFWTQ